MGGEGQDSVGEGGRLVCGHGGGEGVAQAKRAGETAGRCVRNPTNPMERQRGALGSTRSSGAKRRSDSARLRATLLSRASYSAAKVDFVCFHCCEGFGLCTTMWWKGFDSRIGCRSSWICAKARAEHVRVSPTDRGWVRHSHAISMQPEQQCTCAPQVEHTIRERVRSKVACAQ